MILCEIILWWWAVFVALTLGSMQYTTASIVQEGIISFHYIISQLTVPHSTNATLSLQFVTLFCVFYIWLNSHLPAHRLLVWNKSLKHNGKGWKKNKPKKRDPVDTSSPDRSRHIIMGNSCFCSFSLLYQISQHWLSEIYPGTCPCHVPGLLFRLPWGQHDAPSEEQLGFSGI